MAYTSTTLTTETEMEDKTTPATSVTTEVAKTVTKNTYKNWYNSNTVNYNCKGVKNKTSFPSFIKVCQLGQASLKTMLKMMLESLGYEEVISEDGFLYAKGDIPVLLTAHMDTVHKENVKDYYEYYDSVKKQHILSSPQGIGGDDRCGIYMILDIARTHKCSVLFCEDEEIGGVGSKKFCETEYINELSELKYMIELDRKNGTDAVFYHCDSDKFTKFIEDNTGYKKAWGSFSDISNLAPKAGVAAVNLSCGYYNAHTTNEYVIVEEMLNTIKVVKDLLGVECEQFEYVKEEYYYGGYKGYGNYGSYSSYGGYGSYGSRYSDRYYGRYCDSYDDYDDYDEYDDLNYYNRKSYTRDKFRSFFIYFITDDDEYKTYIQNANNIDEAFGKFFKENPTVCYDDIVTYEDLGMYYGTSGLMEINI